MFGPDSIRRRLQRLIVLTTAAVLGVACAVFILVEWRGSLDDEKRAALTTARITADASSGMVAFGNRAEATKLLESFHAEPDVRAAALYDSSGRLFAQYRAFDARTGVPGTAQPDGLGTSEQRLLVFHPITEDGKRFGTLYLRTDLSDMHARLFRYAWIALLIFLVAVVAAYGLGHFLQRSITRPLLSLAETAAAVSRQRNYGVRAAAVTWGELETLTTAFNRMLDTIDAQQTQLQDELAERKRAQEAVAREKQLLATTLASIGDGVIVTDPEGRVISLNAEAERLTGWTSAEAAGRPLPDVFRILNEDTRQPAENPVERVLRLGAVAGLANHTILLRRDGTELPIDDSAAPIRQASGAVFGVVLVFRDFTERKQQEQTLRESEARERARAAELQAIMDAVPAAIWISHDRECRVIRGNRASFELLRLTPGANPSLTAPGSERPTHFEVLVDGRVLPPEELPVQRAARGEQVSDLEEEIRFSDGTSRHLLGNATPLRDAHGELCGAVAAFVDITARRHADAALRDSEERFRRLVENAPFGIYIVDSEFRIRLLNAGAQAAFKNVRPVIGRDFGEAMRVLWPEPVAAQVIAVFRRTLETGEPYFSPGLTEQRHDTGTVESYEWQLHRIPLPDGKFGVVCYFFDATRLRSVEAALREAHSQLGNRALHLEKLVDERTARLQETIGDLEAFSYSIVHDLRAPLRAIRNFTALLLEECGEVTETGRDYVQRVTSAAERMDRLIQDVLNYSRIARAELPLGPVDAGALLRSIVETYPALQPPHARIDFDGDLPAVHANEAALTQCVSNLLGNAVKFVAPGVTPRVRVWSEARDGRVLLRFRDNGIGIEETAHGKIFEMFQRLSKRYEGTGVGLAIVKKAVEKMGGRVGVESEPGHGSTFWLELASARLSQHPTSSAEQEAAPHD